LLRQEIEGRIQSVVGDSPRDQGARSEIGRHQCLSNATDRARSQHCAETFADGGDIERRLLCDFREWIREESGDAIFGHREDARVDGIGDFDGDGRIQH
jgi:hypothetical protein